MLKNKKILKSLGFTECFNNTWENLNGEIKLIFFNNFVKIERILVNEPNQPKLIFTSYTFDQLIDYLSLDLVKEINNLKQKI